MNCGVEPELVPRDAECLGELTRELLLRRNRKRPAHERVVLVGCVFGHEGAELRRQHREDLADLRRAHSGLVVLEQHVVCVVVRSEALDVLSTEIDDALEPGSKRREVRLLAGLDPRLVRLRGDLRELHRKLGRNATLTVPVAPRDADERRVIGVVRERSRVRLELFEELAKALVHFVLVDDLLERGELSCASRSASRRHEHRHVPDEDGFGALEVGELAQAFL